MYSIYGCHSGGATGNKRPELGLLAVCSAMMYGRLHTTEDRELLCAICPSSPTESTDPESCSSLQPYYPQEFFDVQLPFGPEMVYPFSEMQKDFLSTSLYV